MLQLHIRRQAGYVRGDKSAANNSKEERSIQRNMITGNFVFVNDRGSNDRPNPFVQHYLREAEHRNLVSELMRDLQQDWQSYGLDVNLIIDSKVKF